jgi:hypothetical protein
MNTLKTIFCAYSLITCLAASAQEKSFPENIPRNKKIEINTKALEKLFHTTGAFSIRLAPSFTLTGSIQNRIVKSGPVISLLIKTENLQGATLSLSRSVRSDGTVQYTGLLLKLHDAEGMLLTEKDNHYYFIRTEQRYLVSE